MLLDLLKRDILSIGKRNLAERIGLSETVLKNIEENRIIRRSKLNKIYIYYHIPYDEFWYEMQRRRFRQNNDFIGDTIRNLRLSRSYSMLELSKECKLSLKTIYNIESGKTLSWWSICAILGILTNDEDIINRIKYEFTLKKQCK